MTALRPSSATDVRSTGHWPDERLGESLGPLLAPARPGDAEGKHDAADPGRVRLRAATVPVPAVDPIALFAVAIEADLEVALWLRPSEGLALVGVGRAWAVEPSGPTRFRDAEVAWRALAGDARLAGRAAGIAGPTLLGGLGFSGRRPAADDPWAPFGPASLALPQLLLAVRDGAATLTGSIVAAADETRSADARELERRWEGLVDRARAITPGPAGMVARPVFAPLRVEHEQPSSEVWHRLVGMFAGAVGRGRLDKVVLARRVDLRSPVELDVPNALRRLAATAPESTIYAFRRAGRTFLGATPERLVRTEGRSFRTAAVAGSIRRGADAAEDAALGAALLASEKDREEHAIVVTAIRDALTPITERLTVAPSPGVMTLRHVQHLVTEIEGTLPAASGLLALGERLHPTPAVGGAPREAALAMIDEHEGFDRGWYAGPIGWLGVDGDGELCVALRCGVVDRTKAALFAGCGIVADSDPAQEWEESRIKLRAVVSALGIPGDDA